MTPPPTPCRKGAGLTTGVGVRTVVGVETGVGAGMAGVGSGSPTLLPRRGWKRLRSERTVEGTGGGACVAGGRPPPPGSHRRTACSELRRNSTYSAGFYGPRRRGPAPSAAAPTRAATQRFSAADSPWWEDCSVGGSALSKTAGRMSLTGRLSTSRKTACRRVWKIGGRGWVALHSPAARHPQDKAQALRRLRRRRLAGGRSVSGRPAGAGVGERVSYRRPASWPARARATA